MLSLVSKYFKTRTTRQLAFLRLGPNEARILYDFAISVIASIGAILFFYFFIDQSFQLVLLSAPIFFICANALLGTYSRFRMANWRAKIFIITIATFSTSILLTLFKIKLSAVIFWWMLVTPPLILARFFLSLPYSKHKNLTISITQRHGPVLITGGAGYIGSCLTELLLKKGFSVRILDRLMYGRGVLADFEKNQKFELIEGDVTDIESLTRAMKGVWAVVHLAGLVGDAACSLDQEFTRHMNIISTRMVKDVACAMGVSRFIFASSCSVYGMSDKELKETDELNPLSLYAQSKIDSENELLSTSRDDFFVTVLRFSTVFGHSRRARFDLVGNLFTAQAMNEGHVTVIGPHQYRPFIHVTDLARALHIVLDSKPFLIQNQIFNVGDQRFNLSILDLAKIVKGISEQEGRQVAIFINDQDISDKRNYYVSFEKIQKILGFQAKTQLEDGIREMIYHFKNGTYSHYKDEVYNNARVTKKTMNEFYDPLQSMKLYAPLKK